jgi:hypothetical protein
VDGSCGQPQYDADVITLAVIMVVVLKAEDKWSNQLIPPIEVEMFIMKEMCSIRPA